MKIKVNKNNKIKSKLSGAHLLNSDMLEENTPRLFDVGCGIVWELCIVPSCLLHKLGLNDRPSYKIKLQSNIR
jgi:hypothetical protein